MFVHCSLLLVWCRPESQPAASSGAGEAQVLRDDGGDMQASGDAAAAAAASEGQPEGEPSAVAAAAQDAQQEDRWVGCLPDLDWQAALLS